jgi:co-chaperonin GroES (HSP10)
MKAFGERVLVKKIYEDNRKEGVLISKEKVYNDVVEVYSIGDEFGGSLGKGDKLQLTPGAGTLVKINKEDYLSILKNHIIGTL